MTYWMLVGTPENWEIMGKNDFSLCAMKSGRKNYASRVQRGDKVVFYLTKLQAFAGIAEFTSTVKEDHTKLFVSEKKGEDYPWRFTIKPEVMLEKDKAIPAETLKDKLEYIKKWPKEHWKLAFQGNVHLIPETDHQTIKTALEKAK